MKLWPLFKTEARATVENPSTPLSSPNIVAHFGGEVKSTAGVNVNQLNALSVSAVYASIRVLSETIASLPIGVFRDDDGFQIPAEERGTLAIQQLLRDAPNEYQTSFAWRELMVAHLAAWGNHYSVIEFDQSNQPRALLPLAPDRVTIKREAGNAQTYHYQMGTDSVALDAAEVLHIPALGYDGFKGLSPIALFRETIGLAKATEEFGSRFFSNDARPGVVLEFPDALGTEATERVKEAWRKAHQGLSRSHEVAVLQSGATMKEVGIPPEDAQFLETRKFQVADIARIFRVPPHMIGDLEKATFSNIEHQDLGFVKHTIRPWLVRIEQELNRKLFIARNNAGAYAKFNVDGLLRGDFKTRTEGLSKLVNGGIMTSNEARGIEGLPPIDGGDQLRVPVNTMAVGAAADDESGGETVEPDIDESESETDET